MTARRFDALAGRLLERRESGVIDAPAAEDRARAIAAIERAIRQKNRRRLATRLTFAAAAVVLLGLGARQLGRRHEVLPVAQGPSAPASHEVTVVGHPTGGGAVVVETGAPAPLVEGTSLAPGSRILARQDGHVILSVSTGTRLTVEEGGEVSIVDNGSSEVFALHAGAVRADVAKLSAGQRFIIRTSDSEIEVRGTSFRVAMAEADPACEGGTVTRLSVYEGVVSVRHAGREARVAAGQSWPSGCTAKEEPEVRSPARSSVALARARAVAVEVPSAPAGSALSASDLREQNDAFGRAVDAKQRGAAREAIAGFEAFVARYPSSSLVESALAERMRLVRRVEPARAASAASQYLSRFPRGFARGEAESIEQQAP